MGSFHGSGPGGQAPDGSSVELYRLLPYLSELDAVRGLLPARASVLELGCGAGRLTRVLLDWGLRPTCVDNSASMLAMLPAAATPVLSSIEELNLGRHFDVVLLASCLINHPLPAMRDALVAATARHRAPHSLLILERHDPNCLLNAHAGVVGSFGPVTVHLDGVARTAAKVKMRLRYTACEREWIHEFEAAALSEHDIEDLLAAHGWRVVSWHGARCRWLVARTAG